MAQIIKLIQENQKLKYQLEKFKGSNGLLPYVDDSLFKGGYRVVKTITDRDSIDCCHSKQGMTVCVIGEDLSFKEYRLISDCKNKQWEEIQTQVTENDVTLVEDYSELSENLTTQKELNLVLKQLILNLQTQIDNIELTDEKVQITENTNFGQIGDNQKDFNRNVSDYKVIVDNKNIKQDKRIENLEGINYTWSPTNRTLTLYDNNGNQLSQVSLVSLDNEGTDIRYNASTLSLELYNTDNELLDSIPVSSFIGSVGTQLQLNSNQLQLRDSQGNILSTVSFTVNNIQGLQTALDGKLNKPTTTSNTTSYPFVVGEDGNGNSARLPAGDLGKNFFNSDLSNTTARSHTMNAGVTVNTLGNPHTLSGLPNKNTDIANFRKVRVQNTSGLNSVVDSKNILLDVPSQLSDVEKTTWKTQMNGGWTTATMSVSSILPPFIDKSKNYNTFITLNGANLNLNPASFSVEILDLSNNVVVTIPNSQVQLNNVGTSITFYYNFNSIPLGNYKIRLWNGVAYYTSPLTLNVVSTLNNIDLSSAVWQKQELESGKLTTSNNSLTGNLQSATNLLTTPFLAGLLNIPNLTLNDDFIISCTFLGLGGNQTGSTINAAFGLSTSLNITGIVNAVSYGVNVRHYQTKASAAIVGGSGQTAPLNTNQNTSFAFDLIISKSGNILNIAILNPNSGSPVISTVTITPSSQPISLAFFCECNGNAAYTTSFNTVNVIKIN